MRYLCMFLLCLTAHAEELRGIDSNLATFTWTGDERVCVITWVADAGVPGEPEHVDLEPVMHDPPRGTGVQGIVRSDAGALTCAEILPLGDICRGTYLGFAVNWFADHAEEPILQHVVYYRIPEGTCP